MDYQTSISATPVALPAQFEWCVMDLQDDKWLAIFHEFLCQHYVEDRQSMFRFNNSKEFLRWALLLPGYVKNWHLGIRDAKNKRLYGTITATLSNLNFNGDNSIKTAEINFLCVHKKLRHKHMAPVLIKEITRRCQMEANCQDGRAVYTGGIKRENCLSSCHFYHRPLNLDKLLSVGFYKLPPRRSKSLMKRVYSLPESTLTPGLRPMERRDIKQVTYLLQQYMAKFILSPVFDEHNVLHRFLPRTDIIYSYVVEEPESHAITDFVSFHNLSLTIMDNSKYSTLQTAYSYYNVSTKTPISQLMKDLLISARNAGFDVFNCMNVMDNDDFIAPLHFDMGNGNLHYYIYNETYSSIDPNRIGLVLV